MYSQRENLMDLFCVCVCNCLINSFRKLRSAFHRWLVGGHDRHQHILSFCLHVEHFRLLSSMEVKNGGYYVEEHSPNGYLNSSLKCYTYAQLLYYYFLSPHAKHRLPDTVLNPSEQFMSKVESLLFVDGAHVRIAMLLARIRSLALRALKQSLWSFLLSKESPKLYELYEPSHEFSKFACCDCCHSSFALSSDAASCQASSYSSNIPSHSSPAGMLHRPSPPSTSSSSKTRYLRGGRSAGEREATDPCRSLSPLFALQSNANRAPMPLPLPMLDEEWTQVQIPSPKVITIYSTFRVNRAQLSRHRFIESSPLRPSQ